MNDAALVRVGQSVANPRDNAEGLRGRQSAFRGDEPLHIRPLDIFHDEVEEFPGLP